MTSRDKSADTVRTASGGGGTALTDSELDGVVGGATKDVLENGAGKIRVDIDHAGRPIEPMTNHVTTPGHK